jgi:hypothetical protein
MPSIRATTFQCREAKLQLRQEIEKRLDAEQQVFDMKEGMESLRKKIALVPMTIVSTTNGDLDQIRRESGKSKWRQPLHSERCHVTGSDRSFTSSTSHREKWSIHFLKGRIFQKCNILFEGTDPPLTITGSCLTKLN